MAGSDRAGDGVGVLLPTREMAITGEHSMASLVEFARTAEDLGFDSVWTGDSLLARPRLDPVVVLAAAGTATGRVTLGTAAMTATLRHPLVGANLVAALDHACGPGRLRLGVGSGFPIPETEAEFAAVGVPFAGRAGRLDETVRAWRQAWRGGTGLTGRHLAVQQLDRLPPPATPGGPPVWLAGSDTPAVLARAAREYDGWLPFLPSAETYGAAWRRLRELAADAGRPAGAVVPGLYATVTVSDDRAAARAELENYVQRYYARPLAAMATIQAYGYGTAAECADWLIGYVRAGARHLVLRIGSLAPADQLKAVAEVLLPAVRAVLAEK